MSKRALALLCGLIVLFGAWALRSRSTSHAARSTKTVPVAEMKPTPPPDKRTIVSPVLATANDALPAAATPKAGQPPMDDPEVQAALKASLKILEHGKNVGTVPAAPGTTPSKQEEQLHEKALADWKRTIEAHEKDPTGVPLPNSAPVNAPGPCDGDPTCVILPSDRPGTQIKASKVGSVTHDGAKP